MKLFVILAGVSLVLSGAKAAQFEDRFRYDKDSTTKFTPNELSVDLFGTWADRDRFGIKHHDGRGGGGVGLDYFFSRYVGIGADSYVEEWKAPYRVNGSLILRLPLEGPLGFAPYAFGGGGREMKYLTQWTFHGGAGLEFRFNHYTGIFADGRRVFSDKSSSLDYTLLRAGLRLNF